MLEIGTMRYEVSLLGGSKSITCFGKYQHSLKKNFCKKGIVLDHKKLPKYDFQKKSLWQRFFLTEALQF